MIMMGTVVKAKVGEFEEELREGFKAIKEGVYWCGTMIFWE